MDSGLVRQLPAGARPALAGPRAEDGLTMTMSLAEMAHVMSCRFCTMAITRPFDPSTLINASEVITIPVDEDDDNGTMDTAADDDRDPRFFEDDDTCESMLLSQPLTVCSPACWMAQSLLNLGEESTMGRLLLRRYPYLRPPPNGLYAQKRAALAAQMVDYRPLIAEAFGPGGGGDDGDELVTTEAANAASMQT